MASIVGFSQVSMHGHLTLKMNRRRHNANQEITIFEILSEQANLIIRKIRLSPHALFFLGRLTRVIMACV